MIWSLSAKSLTYASWKARHWSATSCRDGELLVPRRSINWQRIWSRHEPHRVSHRLNLVYRLQSVRSRVQGVERSRRGRPGMERVFLRQYRGAWAFDVASCEVCGARATAWVWGQRAGIEFVGVLV